MFGDKQEVPQSILDWIQFIQAPSYLKRISHLPFATSRFEIAPWESIRFGLQGRLWCEDGSIFPIHLNAPGATVTVSDGHYFLIQKEIRPDSDDYLIKFAGSYVPLTWTEDVVKTFLEFPGQPWCLDNKFPSVCEFIKWLLNREFNLEITNRLSVYMISKVSGWPTIVFASILCVAICSFDHLDYKRVSVSELLQEDPGIYKISLIDLRELIYGHHIGCNNSNALAQRIALFGFCINNNI
jgi:hypothetical protein